MYYIITFDLTSLDGVQPWPPSDSSKNCKTYCQSSPAATSLENFPAVGSYIMKFPQTERCNWQLHPMGFVWFTTADTSPASSFKTKNQWRTPSHPTSSFGSVIFTANAQPLHVLIAALKTMISGRMPGGSEFVWILNWFKHVLPMYWIFIHPKQSHNRNMFRTLGPVEREL